MIFSYIERGAGSRADSVLPALPTTVSISGMVATAICNCCNTRLFSSTPACGKEVGIKRKDPSLSEGINSLPVFCIIRIPKITIRVSTDKNRKLLRWGERRVGKEGVKRGYR